jgi:hypothetical protein
MVGRGTLIVILGFSLIFAASSQYWNRNRVAATENLVQYYNATVARNIAESAANLGADSLFWDFNTTNLNLSGSLSGGTYSTTTALISGPDSNVTLTAVGAYQGVDDSVIILLRRYYFSMFAVNIQTMSGTAWATGDTIQGPLHVEGNLNTSGSPVFEGEVTIAGNLNASPVYSPGPPVTGPIFEDNLLTGISVPIPSTSAAAVLAAAQNGGAVFNNPSPGTAYNVYLTFNSDGTVSYKTPGMSVDTTVSLTTLAPNGVIMVDNGILHLQGTVNGSATVGSYSTSSTLGGQVYIEGNIVYNSNPVTNPSSTDMLGIVASYNVSVNPPSVALMQNNYTIDAAIFSQNGEFKANYSLATEPMGTITVYGSITGYTIGATENSSYYGWTSSYCYDSRYASKTPPSYPSPYRYQIVSWWE